MSDDGALDRKRMGYFLLLLFKAFTAPLIIKKSGIDWKEAMRNV